MPRPYDRDARGPLHGIRILDLSRLVAGNMSTHVLADLGADVIKVEHPEKGDDLRRWRVDGIEVFWKVYGRGKRSLGLDLRRADHRAVLERLVPTAQALVENFTPGTLETMGFAPQRLWQLNAGLVILRISGWGQTGLYRERPGFGTLVEAMSGFAALNGFADRPPALPPIATADMIAGLYGAVALLTALRHVEVDGGPGQVVDLSLFDPILSFVSTEAVQHRLTGRPSPRAGNQSNHTAPRNVYACADGQHLALSASTQGMALRLFAAMGRPDLGNDPRFATNEARVANREVLDAIVGGFIAERSLATNLAFFEAASVTVGPVCSVSDLPAHPYCRSREAFVEMADTQMGSLPMHNVVPRLSVTPGVLRMPAPALGAHSQEILAELGLDRAAPTTGDLP